MNRNDVCPFAGSVIADGWVVAEAVRIPTEMFSLADEVLAIAMLVTAPFVLLNGTRIRLTAAAAGAVPS